MDRLAPGQQQRAGDNLTTRGAEQGDQLWLPMWMRLATGKNLGPFKTFGRLQ
jgi:hypothetical protein